MKKYLVNRLHYWVKQTMEPYISYDIPGWNEAYGSTHGYQWWQRTYKVDGHSVEAVQRSGWGCQKIILFPEYDVMVVMTSGYYIEGEPVNELLVNYIIPSLNPDS